MKVGCISDIHIDMNREFDVLGVLAQTARKKQLDALVIAGDISNHYTTTLAFLKQLGVRMEIPCYFVPGNHDLWDESGTCRNTEEIFKQYQEHPHCLIGRGIPLAGDWVLIGNTGWYDYSFSSPKYQWEDFAKRKLGQRTWMDSINVRWGKADRQVHLSMLAQLEEQMVRNRGKKLIAVTHMLPDAYFTVPESVPEWDYFNAFLGSRDYGGLYEQEEVQYAVCGHVHYRKRYQKQGTKYICACLNYHTQWAVASCEVEMEHALTVIEIE